MVIRKSTIKDGKIIIPPSGLYITVRSTNWHPFDNEPLTLAGKTYHAITDRYVRDVIRNVTMKKGPGPSEQRQQEPRLGTQLRGERHLRH